METNKKNPKPKVKPQGAIVKTGYSKGGKVKCK